MYYIGAIYAFYIGKCAEGAKILLKFEMRRSLFNILKVIELDQINIITNLGRLLTKLDQEKLAPVTLSYE